MRASLLSLLGLSTLALNVFASTSSLPSWISGNTNCRIDGRPAKMNWKVVDDPQTTCEGNICTSTSGVKTVGSFSDNGGPWTPLAMQGLSNAGKTMNIRYLGAEQDNWQLTYDANTEMANGWTTWRGKHYPLACWKGAVSLPDQCNTYADKAVDQYQAAQNRHCGLGPDARWHNDHNAHYQWCLSVKGNPTKLNAEIQARSQQLAHCKLISITPNVRIPLHRP